MKTRIFTLIMALVIPTLCWAADTPPTEEIDGKTFYLLDSKEDLIWFQEYVDAGNTDICAKLEADIDLNPGITFNENGYEGDTEPQIWEPIGNGSRQYEGVFDGNAHTISGIYINNENFRNALFDFNKGTIRNLGVVNSYLAGSLNLAGICGQLQKDATIENCYFAGYLNCDDNEYGEQIGGICGFNNGGTIQNCYNAGTIKGYFSSIGGICGSCTGDNTGSLGGISYPGTIKNCLNTGKMIALGDEALSGICGESEEGSITNSYYLTGSATTDVTGSTEASTIDAELIEKLNEGNESPIWGIDIDNNEIVMLPFVPEAERENYVAYELTLNDGTTTYAYSYNIDMPLPEPAEREGFVFQGWYTEPDGKGTKAEGSFKATDANTTYYAYWTEAESSPSTPPLPDYPEYYNIYVESCDGAEATLSSQVVKEGTSVTLTIETAEGYDAENMVVKFKRSLFGYWETATPDADGTYQIRNIYADIYIVIEGVEEETPTGIEDIEDAQVYTRDGSLFIQTPQPEQVLVISASGAVLKNERFAGLRQFDGLSRGVYIICIGNERFKVRI